MDKSITVPGFSVVVPVYNDQEVLPELLRRLYPVCQRLAEAFEIVLVDDGSRDASWPTVLKLREQYPAIVAVKLARNFGQQNAITAGLDTARHEYIAIMDSDLQDPPELLADLLAACVANDVDMAIARRASRKDTFFKKLVSKAFNSFVKYATSLRTPDGVGVFRVLRKAAYDKIRNVPEITGTTISLLYWGGFDYVLVDMERQARFAGTSGYTLRKMLHMASARIFSYSLWPLRVATTLGVCISGASLVLAAVYLVRYLLHGATVAGWTTLVVLLLFLFGLLFLILGVMGEYLGRIYLETKNRPKYVIGKIKRE